MRDWFAAPLVLLPFILGCATPSQLNLDAEVKRLCTIDGGIKVYETVQLPAENFNEWGQVKFFRATQGENALGPEYVFKQDERYLHGDTRDRDAIAMRRIHSKVVRKKDGKLLGEAVMYNRTGGDVPGPWMPSSYYCPDPKEAGSTILLQQIFTR